MFKEDGDLLETVNENFEADLKRIDPGFDLANCQDILDGLDR